MTLIRFDDVSLKFGDQPILTQASLIIEPGERIGLIGRNGAGKSTTFKLINGEQQADDGEIQRKSLLKVSQLAQDLPAGSALSVRDAVTEGLAEVQQLVDDYQQRSQHALDEAGLRELEQLHQHIDAMGGWGVSQRVDATLSELSLPTEKRLDQLSGGWRRRVALAKALVSHPDLLLLDEPTNHLDIATIEWLEHKVRSFPGAIFFVTHDRAFLQRLATRIVELDRGKLVSWPGDYKNFLRRKEKALQDELVANKLFDKKLAQEEEWIRKGVKARRTRNQGRVRTLLELREEYGKRLKLPPPARIQIEAAEASGRKVIRARNVSYSYDGKPLIKDFSLALMRGDRIGLVGNNGVGKSTLLRLMLGELEPQTGTVKLGTNLAIGYYDQLRVTLEAKKSVAHNVGNGREYIKMGGRERHIISYLKGFLFEPKRAQMPVSALSGGERNRVILAKLFTQPANFLILDEPTNDLDMETLEVLERELKKFAGTLIVVSHDRAFLDEVVDSVLVFEAGGNIGHYVGGYSDWQRQHKQLAESDETPPGVTESDKGSPAQDGATSAPKKPKKLSFNQQYQLKQLPERIADLEKSIAELQAETTASDFYKKDHTYTKEKLQELADQIEELDQATHQWLELEELAS